ncbi:uncharacterized protein [Lolium perenne]|uniref:uncharacterized protein n=1 Tax=Lolium perenne TaxID=4522 RepID=UPI003A990AF1
MDKFKDVHNIHDFVKAQMVAGAKFALICMKIFHSKLDLDKVCESLLLKMSKRKINIDKHNAAVSPVAEKMIDELLKLSGFFDGCEFHHVPRANNEAADALSKIGSTRQAIPPGVALAVLKKPSIIPSPDSDSIFVPADPGAAQPNPGASSPKSGANKPNPPASMPNPGTSQSNPGASSPNSRASKPNPPASKPNPATMQSNPEAPTQEALLVSVFEIRCVPSWAQEFLSYLTDGVLPDDRVQARQTERRAKAYTIINHQLYKRSVSGVFQRCVEPAEGIELLREIHQGECGHHASSRAIVAKAFRHGFYWPTALRDAEDLVKKCNGCQRFAKQRHQPASALKTIPITWPFAVWGLDMSNSDPRQDWPSWPGFSRSRRLRAALASGRRLRPQARSSYGMSLGTSYPRRLRQEGQDRADSRAARVPPEGASEPEPAEPAP